MDKVIAIALTTTRELIRSKILVAVGFFAVLVVLVATFFGSVTIGDQILVVKDFGLFALSVSSVAFAVISGGSLLHKELAKKTIYNVLSKAVYRWQFLLGKYLGILATTTLLLFLMGLFLQLFLLIFDPRFDPFLWLAYLHIFFELVIICAAAIFFSSIVITPILSGLFTFAIFLAGRSVEYLLYFIKEGQLEGALAGVLKTAYYLLPQLSKLNISNEVVFSRPELLSLERVFYSCTYSFGYAAVLLLLATFFFNRREFN